MSVLKQRGDTIVEVLIAMTVASSVLGFAYSTMNKNLLISRTAQERTEATKVAQGQVEILRSMSLRSALPAGAIPFCAQPTGTSSNIAGGNPHADPKDDNFDNYATANCSLSYYNYAVTKDASVAKLYHVTVRWEDVRGTGRNQVTMSYRVK